MKKISVVIPAYNEVNLIVETVKEVVSELNNLSLPGYEVIVVDDGSYDATFDLIKKLANPRVRCIRLSRNSGSHIALRAGLAEAKGDAVLCISADGQDDSGCLREMLELWRKGNKIIWALRRSRNNESWFIRVSAKLFYSFLLWLVGARNISVDLSRADFCLIDRKVADAINACPERNTSLFGLIAWLGFSQGSVEYDRRPRKDGHSKWSFRNRVRLAKDWIIAFSGLPLKIVSIIGFFFAALGLIYATYVALKALFVYPALGWSSIPGWSSTIVIILILGGIQMIILGVIGEYLWRNLDESRRRPLYFIEATTEDKESDSPFNP